MSYDNFPPAFIFKKVLAICPEAALSYALLWEMKGKKKRVSVKRLETKKIFSVSPTIFRNYLHSLALLDILTFEESLSYFLIDFYDIK